MFDEPEQNQFPTAASLEQLACHVGLAASVIVREGYGNAQALRSKSSPTDIVTQTDIDSENLVRSLLADLSPNSGVLGEEGGGTDPGRAVQWIIDPLDGTINFLYGVPLFAVSIAAAIEGVVVAGAVIDVLRKDVFSAHLGGGASLNNEPITASKCEQLSRALVMTGFSYSADLRARQGHIVQGLLPEVRDIRCFGSAALELCWVACGRADGYFERDTKLWDYAAGALIAHEAGAQIELPCPENQDLVLAASTAIFADLRSRVT